MAADAAELQEVADERDGRGGRGGGRARGRGDQVLRGARVADRAGGGAASSGARCGGEPEGAAAEGAWRGGDVEVVWVRSEGDSPGDGGGGRRVAAPWV